MRKKADLPQKQCAECNRPFTWRKKWARDWERVRYCSERCRRSARQARTAAKEPPPS
ncbi:DUF2256 domain-containing protein [Rhodothalassium salexigens]|uniref:DUF2256 domain-containing protein n=1 Tax=Rhodothalassium salexigens TaxID=1086 RepID=UPI00104D7220|nr:DUF2256 domain-containing protein [Rhodothalassium salexigens]MBB4212202.1 hypothetical protein [Rhodothalassium salexigens DSM 2132]MBK1639691.1 hypothetical protein [Rhodothalassium salexigens DSM 2132]